MFEMRAAGTFTDREICQRINAMGFGSRMMQRWDSSHEKVLALIGNRPLTPYRLRLIMRRPIYCGVICGPWTGGKPVKTAYPGLVSIDTFNRASRGKVYIVERSDGTLDIEYDIEAQAARRRYSRNDPLFPYRHVIMCQTCGKPLYGSSPTGKSGKRFPTYHCARKHPYFGVSKVTLETAFQTHLGRLRYRQEVADVVTAGLHETFVEYRGTRTAERNSIGRTISTLQARRAELTMAFTRATTRAMQESIERELVATEAELERATLPAQETIEQSDLDRFLADVRFTLEHPDILLEYRANTEEMRALYGLVYERYPTYEEIAFGTPKLRYFFYLISGEEPLKSQMVHHLTFSWNTVETEILHWGSLLPFLPPIARGFDDAGPRP
jgi:hypothetical protein